MKKMVALIPFLFTCLFFPFQLFAAYRRSRWQRQVQTTELDPAQVESARAYQRMCRDVGQMAEAIKRDDLESLKRLLGNHRINVSGHDSSRRTALHFAAEKGNVEAVQLLLKHGADPNIMDELGCTPMFYVVLELFNCGPKRVNSRQYANYGQIIGDTTDCVGNYLSIAQLLCDSGVNLDIWSERRQYGRYGRCVEMLTDRLCKEDASCLRAVENAAVKMLILFINHGFDLSFKRPHAKFSSSDIIHRWACGSYRSDIAAMVADRGGTTDIVENDYDELWQAVEQRDLETMRRLLEKGVDVTVLCGPNNSFPLLYAASNGHVDSVMLLLEFGAQANQGGGSPLMSVCQKIVSAHSMRVNVECREYLEIAKELCQRGASFRGTNRSGKNCVDLLLSGRSCAAVKEMIKLFIEYNVDPENERTLQEKVVKDVLYWATRKNTFVDIVELLLSKGACMDTIWEYAFRRANVELMSKYIRKVGGLDKVPCRFPSLLHEAVSLKNLSLVRALIEFGADLNVLDCNARSPLDCAKEMRLREIAQVLLDAQTNANNQGNAHRVAVQLSTSQTTQADQISATDSVSTGPQMIFPTMPVTAVTVPTATATSITSEATLSQIGMLVRELEQQKSKNQAIHEQMAQMQTMMQHMTRQNEEAQSHHYASKSDAITTLVIDGDIDAVCKLLEQGASPNKVDNEGKTLLHLATQYGHELLACVLLEYQAMPNCRVLTGEHAGRTPLHYAVINSMTQLIESLLVVGASLAIADERGYTPLHWAASNGDENLVRLLLQHGAQADVRDSHGETPLSLAGKAGQANIEVLLEDSLPDVNGRTCSICLNGLLNGESGIVAANCGHPLHQECARELDRCPLCMVQVEPGEWRKIHL